MSRLALLLVALLAATASARAQGLSAAAQFDVPSTVPGDTVNYTITLSGGSIPRLGATPQPDFSALDVLHGPSTSTSSQMSISNGQMRSRTIVTLTWLLQTRGPGRATVPGFSLQLGGEELRVPADSLEVQPPAPGQAPPSARAPGRARAEGRSPWSDPFEEMQPGRRRSAPAPRLELQSELSDATPWVGEEIVLDHVLLFSGQVSSYSLGKPADVAGFSKSDNHVKDPKTERERDPSTGAVLQKAVIARWTLTPLLPGDQEIPAQPYTFTVNVETPGFPGFFADQRQVERVAPGVKVSVRPLPADAPPGFSGAVGSFRLSAEIDRSGVKQGESVTLTVTVTGTGNFATVKAPELALPEGLRAFDPEVKTETSFDRGGRTGGLKSFKYPLLVTGSGRLTIPPLKWAYFDPRAGHHVARETTALAIDAEPSALAGAETPFVAAAPAGEREVRAFGEDIAHVRSALGAVHAGREAARLPAWAWLGLGAGPLLPALLLAGRGLRALARRDPARARRAGALGRARGRIQQARAHVKAGRTREACDAAARALQGYVSDRLLLSEATPASAEVERRIGEWGGSELAREVGAVLAECDLARFAAAGSVDAARLVEAADRALGRLAELPGRAGDGKAA